MNESLKDLRKRVLIRMKRSAMLCNAAHSASNLPPEALVAYRGINYVPISYTLSYGKNGEVLHRVQLRSLTADSFMTVNLGEITCE